MLRAAGRTDEDTPPVDGIALACSTSSGSRIVCCSRSKRPAVAACRSLTVPSFGIRARGRGASAFFHVSSEPGNGSRLALAPFHLEWSRRGGNDSMCAEPRHRAGTPAAGLDDRVVLVKRTQSLPTYNITRKHYSADLEFYWYGIFQVVPAHYSVCSREEVGSAMPATREQRLRRHIVSPRRTAQRIEQRTTQRGSSTRRGLQLLRTHPPTPVELSSATR